MKQFNTALFITVGISKIDIPYFITARGGCTAIPFVIKKEVHENE